MCLVAPISYYINKKSLKGEKAVEQIKKVNGIKIEEKKTKDRFRFLFPYINIFLFVTVLFVVVYKLELQNHVRMIQGCMLAGILFLLTAFSFHSMRNGFSWKAAVRIAVIIGFIMRIGYMLYTSYETRSIDLGDSNLEGYGHAAYILKIMFNRQLPETNWVQFYHPPLFHFLAACLCGTVNRIMGYTRYEDILEIAKIVSCVASCWSLMLVVNICDELKLSDRAKTLAAVIIGVLPSCYLMSARVNNDSLVTYFMILAILYTIKWYQKQSWANTVGLALAFGLGMMTKTSCGNIALFTGTLMLYTAYKRFGENSWKELVHKFIGFGAIAFPLGLWYTVRNYFLFGQPFGYVVRIDEKLRIYTGDVSWVKRFLEFPVERLFTPEYSDPWEEYNISIFVIKSSLFSEFKFLIKPVIPQLLIFFNTLVIGLSLAAMLYVLMKWKNNKMLRFGMPALWLVVMCSYIYFNIAYPFGCTMDFRYIVPTAFLGAIFMGAVFERACKGKSKKAFVCRSVIGITVSLFAILSILMFCLVGY